VYILSYLNLNPLKEDHANRFSLTQKQVGVVFHELKPLLDKALELAQALPAQTDAALQAQLINEQKLLHDATEGPISRPVDDERQQSHYSGKKKAHTVKNAVLINTLSLIVFLGATVAGRVMRRNWPILSTV
jgi:hypothetical protein